MENKTPTVRKNFKGQLDEEQVLFFFRRHWLKIMPNLMNLFIIFLFLTTAIIFTGPLFKNTAVNVEVLAWIYFAVLLFFLILTHHQFLKIFHYHLDTVILTNVRLVILDKSVYLRDSRDSVDILKIQDVNKKQNGIFPRLFDYGTLVITLAGSDTMITIELVPTPDHYFKRINKIKQEIFQGAGLRIAEG